MATAASKNPRLTPEERSLIKGALRRVFGRSDLRRKVIDSYVDKSYSDPKRKRVKYWIKCTECGKMEAKSNIELDHNDPVIPVHTSFAEMSIDETVDRMWCEESNLKPVCKPCHRKKSALETKQRAANRRDRKKGK